VVTPVALHAVAAAGTSGSLAATAAVVQSALLQACWSAVAAGALFAAADYALVRRRWLRSIKMTFDEVKRDAKEQDGDPHAKSRRRQLHRTLVRGGVARTREASFVIANPTHIAIAIRYAPPAVPVPEIVCRARDTLALEVRAIAERAGIPVVADVALARWLWRTGESGRPIPAETFVAVAMTIAALVRAGVLRA
jgi:type III secretion protein U